MACEHVEMINEEVEPSAPGCEECLREGTWWVRLRICLVCGHVGCCDSSPNQHARASPRSRQASHSPHPSPKSGV